MAALESQPLLGFVLKADSLQKTQFKLYHKHTLYYIFKADDSQIAQRYAAKSEDMLHIVIGITIFIYFFSLPGGLNLSGKQLFFNSFFNLILKNILTVFHLGAICILKCRYIIFCIKYFNCVSTVNVTTQMFVASLDGFLRSMTFLKKHLLLVY